MPTLEAMKLSNFDFDQMERVKFAILSIFDK